MKSGRFVALLSTGFVVAGGCGAWSAYRGTPAPTDSAPSIAPRYVEPPVAGVYEEGLLDLRGIGEPETDSGDGPPAVRVELPGAAARAAGLDALRAAMRFAEAGDASGAAREFDRAGALLPAVADWTAVLAARAFAGRGDLGEVRRRLSAVAGSPADEWAWRAEYDAHLVLEDTAAAIAVAMTAASRVRTAAEQAVAWSRAGSLRLATGDPGRALDAFRQAMVADRTTRGGLDAASGAHDLPGLTPEDQLLIGRTLLAHGGLERAAPMIEAFAASSAVLTAERDEALLEIGRALFDSREYERAERNLGVVADRVPEAGFLQARALYRRGRQDDGVRTFGRVAERFPASEAAADALFVLGDLAHDEGRVAAAAEYYRQAVATGAHNLSAAEAIARLAGIGLMAANPAAARADIQAYFASRPADRGSLPAIYWDGRVAAALGDDDGATARYRQVLDIEPFSYYGVLAARRLGTALADVPIGVPPGVSTAVAEEIEIAFFRIDLLRNLGLDAEAGLELARLRAVHRSDPPALYAVAEALSAHGQPVAGALLGRDIQRATGVWDDRLLRIVFQFPFQELVETEARRQGLDPYVVAGLIRQESFFNPIVASAAGAVGLMQVMPATGTELARRAGIDRFSRSMLTDPAINLRLGSLYLADQMRRWDGRLSDVFSAYNAGPTRVARWRQFPEHSDDEIYVERIPLAETRDYVKRVVLYGEVYRRLYGRD